MKNSSLKKSVYIQKKEQLIKKSRNSDNVVFNIQNTLGKKVTTVSVSLRVEEIVKNEFAKIKYSHK
ncbi:hypothetical protein LZQ00_08665 [Sphingobacterium sp. SRCM116780]|uniref:hypothetical protein n=1 Tax=Sphingobacterium sp. SRCM116780 TaxID=2907623 RepID=UPI001F307424|nr:hypothetical protein [Sphingobacterium sp. SRCM116780]UIR57878.1 hypothetical protein LZQ00_08665 [Sphingobacterium sp. SRCM116780]